MNCESKNDCVEICNMKCQLNILSRPHGSALLSAAGNTVVAAAIYGPVDVKQHKLRIDKASVEVCFHCTSGPSSAIDKLYESIVYEICDSAILTSQYPRTSINIILQGIQSETSVLSTAINSACLALMNAGICMNYLFAAVTCIIDENGTIVTTSNSATTWQERDGPVVEVMFVFENINLNVISSRTLGSLTESQYHECLIKGKEVCSRIFEFYKKVIKNFAHII